MNGHLSNTLTDTKTKSSADVAGKRKANVTRLFLKKPQRCCGCCHSLRWLELHAKYLRQQDACVHAQMEEEATKRKSQLPIVLYDGRTSSLNRS